MVFSSVEFLALFLPLFFVAYLATPSGTRNLTLCFGSWVFYAWWKPVFLLLIVGITFVAWFLGRVIAESDDRRQRQVLAAGIVVILGCLAWFKYANLLVRTADEALATLHTGPIPWTNVVLPIALSFTALQAVSYLIDVRRRTVAAEPSFISFAAYLDMFPHLIAGPIIRYSWVDKALIERQLTFKDLSIGARRFMLGFKYPENFRDPYLAVTIQDFWRRWHISLSSWLRDYLYISLGGNRYGDVRTYTNLFLTMAIGGLWHGASWSFLLWGVIHGVALSVARFWG